MRRPPRVEDVRDRVEVGEPRPEEEAGAVEGEQDVAQHDWSREDVSVARVLIK